MMYIYMAKKEIVKKAVVKENTGEFETESLEPENKVVTKPMVKVKPKPILQPKPVVKVQPQKVVIKPMVKVKPRPVVQPKPVVKVQPQKVVIKPMVKVKPRPVVQPEPVVEVQPQKVVEKVQPKPVAQTGGIVDKDKLRREKAKELKRKEDLKLFASEAITIKRELDGLSKLPSINIPIIRAVDFLIKHAFFTRASDIHFEPFEKYVNIRLRVDGVLHDSFKFPKESQSGLITRIKVLAGMRTDEHRAAQDGRFRVEVARPVDRDFDIRVSVVPTYYGEKAVLRLLAEQAEIESLDDLAFTVENRAKLNRALAKPYGMILATGPTGSGKTTTLYTSLKAISSREVSIITIEDPIEYSIEGVDQIQVNNQTNLTFANGLRSILRQDPDAIMVGEIRDQETASIAVNAALTGHKMFSTLHTNDAATTLPRLLDMKVEPFLIASTINIAIGQRLLRMICLNCRVKRRLTDLEFQGLKEAVPITILKQHREFYKGQGCKSCNRSGYKSRVGIYEILEIDDDIREAIIRRADAGELKKIAIKKGMRTMMEDAFQKALDGVTTIEEVLKMTYED